MGSPADCSQDGATKIRYGHATWYRFSLTAFVLNSFLLSEGKNCNPEHDPAHPWDYGWSHVWVLRKAYALRSRIEFHGADSRNRPHPAWSGPFTSWRSSRFPGTIFDCAIERIPDSADGMAVFEREISSLNLVGDGFFTGVIMIVLASVAWVLSALSQKQLLLYYSSQQIVAVIYLSGANNPARRCASDADRRT